MNRDLWKSWTFFPPSRSASSWGVGIAPRGCPIDVLGGKIPGVPEPERCGRDRNTQQLPGLCGSPGQERRELQIRAELHFQSCVGRADGTCPHPLCLHTMDATSPSASRSAILPFPAFFSFRGKQKKPTGKAQIPAWAVPPRCELSPGRMPSASWSPLLCGRGQGGKSSEPGIASWFGK